MAFRGITYIFIIGACATLAQALRCYTCNDLGTSGTCLDSFANPASSIVTCDATDTVCYKYKTFGTSGGTAVQLVNRGCGTTTKVDGVPVDLAVFSSNSCTSPIKVPVQRIDTSTWVCKCEGDLCNSSIQTKQSIMGVILSALAVVIFRMVM